MRNYPMLMKQALQHRPDIKALMKHVPDDGMTFAQLRELLFSKGAKAKGDEKLPWPETTADGIMWKQLQNERTEMAAVLQKFKRSAADFEILRNALQ